MRGVDVRRLTAAAVVGAAYAALTMLLAPISYGPVQLRLSELLCVLPFFEPLYAWGLFMGCLIANGMSSGGLPDIVFGALATLLAGLSTGALGRRGRGWLRSVLGCLMPVVFNSLVVGAVLAFSGAAEGRSFGAAWLLYGGQLALSEAAVMLLLGLPLLRLLLVRMPPWLTGGAGRD